VAALAREPSEPPREWIRLHSRALEACGSELVKVVIAREAVSAGSIDPVAAFFAAAAKFPLCRAFLIRNGETTFIGATPETLCRIKGEQLETEALAGTAAPGAGEALLKSEKDLREHRLVIEDIKEALSPLAADVRASPKPELLTLPNAVHLRTPITARFSGSPAKLVLALHPTAAVNGRPREAARKFLRERELFDRGWYAGVVGRVSNGQAELRVALRSALVGGAEARLFAGVGIVTGSDARAEWLETERKLAAMRDALGVAA
jgi:salicylate biosynthesis isochorismate synthase/menaquinone-specific isochorismate synthase